jgi:hypothetical protein
MNRIVKSLAVVAAASFAGVSHAAPTTVNVTGTTNGIGNGFGNVFGTESSIDITVAGSTVTMVFNQGSGGFFNGNVVYIDSIAGGVASTTPLTDTADGGRSIASGNNGSNNDITFAPGFEADFAISMENTFAGLFDIATDPTNFGFVAGVGTTNFDGDAATKPRTIQFDLSQIGIAAGDSFKFISNYFNAGNGFRSDEFHGVAESTIAGQRAASPNVGDNPVVLASGDFNTVNTIPEPGSLALLGLGTLLIARRRRA